MDCNRGRSTSANAASIRRSNHFRVPGSCLLYFSAATAACATSPCNEWKYAAGSTSPVFEPGSAATHPGGYNCRVTVSYTCLTGGCAGQSFTTTGGPKGLSSRTNPNGCQVYVSAPPLPVAECGSSSCNSVGDPINPASGGVHAVESDQGDREGALTFRRFYNSAGSQAVSSAAVGGIASVEASNRCIRVQHIVPTCRVPITHLRTAAKLLRVLVVSPRSRRGSPLGRAQRRITLTACVLSR